MRIDRTQRSGSDVPILDLLPADLRSRVSGRRATLAVWANHSRLFHPPVPVLHALGRLERYRGLYSTSAVRLEDGSVLWTAPDRFVRLDPTDAGLPAPGGEPSAAEPEELIAPIARSYWVADEKLIAGFLPGDTDPAAARNKLARLVYFGVRHVVNLMEVDERDTGGRPFAPYGEALAGVAREYDVAVTCERHPIRDVSVTTQARMRAILDSIDHAIAADRCVYVHCWGGRGRTGTVVGCWLARHGLAVGDAALARIRELRARAPDADRQSPETADQRAMVRGWGRGE